MLEKAQEEARNAIGNCGDITIFSSDLEIQPSRRWEQGLGLISSPTRIAMQQASYCTRFAEVLQGQKSQSSAEDVIDAEHGLAARWRDATLTE